MHTHIHGDFSHNMNTHPLELVFTVIIFLRQSALVGMESWAHCVASWDPDTRMYRVCGIVRFTSDISPQTTTSLLPLMYEFSSKGTPGKVSISYWNLWFCIIFIIRYEAVSVSRFSSNNPPPSPPFRQVAIGALSTVPHLYKIVLTMNWPLQFFQTCKKNQIRIYTYNLKVAKKTQHASHMKW